MMDKYKNLYRTVNELMGQLGAKGSITTRHANVTAVMDALHDIDGGVFKPELAYTIDTDEVLEAIKENDYYDDFIEMMDKDCFLEASAVFGKAEEMLKKECKHGESLSGCCNACADSGKDPRNGHYVGLDRNKTS